MYCGARDGWCRVGGRRSFLIICFSPSCRFFFFFLCVYFDGTLVLFGRDIASGNECAVLLGWMVFLLHDRSLIQPKIRGADCNVSLRRRVFFRLLAGPRVAFRSGLAFLFSLRKRFPGVSVCWSPSAFSAGIPLAVVGIVSVSRIKLSLLPITPSSNEKVWN